MELIPTLPSPNPRGDWVKGSKKTGVTKHLAVFNHAGLLVNEPPSIAEVPFC